MHEKAPTGRAHALDDGRTYKDLMADLDAALAERPYTTTELKEKFPEWPAWQVENCLGYIGAVRAPGKTRFDPWLAYGKNDPNRPVPQIDTDVEDYFLNYGDPADATALKAYLVDEKGHSAGKVAQAYARLNVRAVKEGRRWVRTRKPLGGEPELPDQGLGPGHEAMRDTMPMRLVLHTLEHSGPSTFDELADVVRGNYPEAPSDLVWHRAEARLKWAVEAAASIGFTTYDAGDRRHTITKSGQDHLDENTEWRTV